MLCIYPLTDLLTPTIFPVIVFTICMYFVSSALMDNSRISDAAREKNRAAEKAAADEKKRIFAVKASRYNRTMSGGSDIFN
jgi:hypothetical protein